MASFKIQSGKTTHLKEIPQKNIIITKIKVLEGGFNALARTIEVKMAQMFFVLVHFNIIVLQIL